jgi:hypothetical protein
MNKGRVADERGGKEMDRYLLTVVQIDYPSHNT